MTPKRQILLFLGFFAIAMWGCASGGDRMVKSTQGPAEQLFAEGKAAYAKQDWAEAIRLFEQLRIQSPASQMAAEATYLEAMARYNQDMFAGAAVDFRAVRRSYPSSVFASRSQYMIGESYYQISPRPELDQSYTTLAIGEFQTFLRDYPSAPQPLLDSAQHRISELRNKIAQKYYLSAKLYDKLDDPKSAAVYYQRVLDNFYDSPVSPEAQLRLAEINFDRHKLDDSRKALDAFDGKYLHDATSDQRNRAQKLRSKLPTP